MGKKRVHQSESSAAHGGAGGRAAFWCYYCESEAKDEVALIQHQAAKHFACPFCDVGAFGRLCQSLSGLVSHVRRSHRKDLEKVPGAIEGRQSTTVNVFGMSGIPPEFLAARQEEQGADEPMPPPPDVEPPPPTPAPAPAFPLSGLASLLAPTASAAAATAAAAALPPSLLASLRPPLQAPLQPPLQAPPTLPAPLQPPLIPPAAAPPPTPKPAAPMPPGPAGPSTISKVLEAASSGGGEPDGITKALLAAAATNAPSTAGDTAKIITAVLKAASASKYDPLAALASATGVPLPTSVPADEPAEPAVESPPPEPDDLGQELLEPMPPQVPEPLQGQEPVPTPMPGLPEEFAVPTAPGDVPPPPDEQIPPQHVNSEPVSEPPAEECRLMPFTGVQGSETALFKSGCKVRLRSLVIHAKLNGSIGNIMAETSKMPETVRVQLDNGKDFTVKMKNLEIILEEDSKGGRGRSRSRRIRRSRSRSRRKTKWDPVPPPAEDIDPSLLKPSMCMPFTEGLCKKGNECPFAHNLRELQPGGFKPRLCPSYQQGECPRMSVCIFAHSAKELPPNFKTVVCANFKQGFCRKQSICTFAHGDEELKFFQNLMGTTTPAVTPVGLPGGLSLADTLARAFGPNGTAPAPAGAPASAGPVRPLFRPLALAAAQNPRPIGGPGAPGAPLAIANVGGGGAPPPGGVGPGPGTVPAIGNIPPPGAPARPALAGPVGTVGAMGNPGGVGTTPAVGGPVGNMGGPVGIPSPPAGLPARPGLLPPRPSTLPVRGVVPNMAPRAPMPQTILALRPPGGAGQTPSRPSMGRPPIMGATGLAPGGGASMPSFGAGASAADGGMPEKKAACVAWGLGTCQLGANCPFAHIGLLGSKKPKTCAQWEMGGCPLGRSCPLAHN